MNIAEIIREVESHGGHLSVSGGKLIVEAPAPLPDSVRSELRANKPALLALLTEGPIGAEVADALDSAMRLGQQLAQGKVTALRCGLTGKECRLCCGIPCLGSTPADGSGQGG